MLNKAKEEIAKSIAKASGAKYNEALSTLEIPQHFGDLTSKIAFLLASGKKESPVKIAADIAATLEKNKPKFVEKVEAKGPYINFYFSGEFYVASLEHMLREKKNFGKGKNTGKKIIVEYFHANTHKGVHIGHIRNASLGESLSRILEFRGNNVIRINYQGDIGPHVAKCLWGTTNIDGWMASGDDMGIALGRLYTNVSKQMEGNEKLKKEVQEINLKLYSGDKEVLKIWKSTRQACLDYFEKFYKEFGIKFDQLYFESQTEKIGKKIALELVKKGIAKQDQGAIIMDLRDNDLGVFVLLTKEGYALYSAKDLGLAKIKFTKYRNVDSSIHVVGKEQEFYFKQLFKTFEKIGGPLYGKAAKVSHHLIYELVMLPEGKMSSREGTMVLYEDLKAKLVEILKQEVKKRHDDWDEESVENTAKKIMLAAIKFSMLRRESNRQLIFDWDEALNLEGNSGPYLQYAYVRTNGILRKAGYKPEIVKNYKFDENERALIRKLCEFPEIVDKCAKDLSSHALVGYLLDVATELNKFYTTSPVLVAKKDEEKKTRLAIVSATSELLRTGLYLLGIEAVERM